MEGKDTELDKTIVEAIKDPLIHLVRNAVSHGIESPEVRRQRGKPPDERRGTLPPDEVPIPPVCTLLREDMESPRSG